MLQLLGAIVDEFERLIVADPNREYAAMACYHGGRLRIVRVSRISERHSCLLDPRRIAVFVVNIAVRRVFYIHNHPNDNLGQSGQDLDVEHEIALLLNKFKPELAFTSMISNRGEYTIYNNAGREGGQVRAASSTAWPDIFNALAARP